MKFRHWLAGWYMGRVAGRYCPCEWPIKVKYLMHLCGRIDDLNERGQFIRFCGFVLEQHQTTSSSATVTPKVTWRRHRP